jgi:hypothetical protein
VLEVCGPGHGHHEWTQGGDDAVDTHDKAEEMEEIVVSLGDLYGNGALSSRE